VSAAIRSFNPDQTHLNKLIMVFKIRLESCRWVSSVLELPRYHWILKNRVRFRPFQCVSCGF